MDCDAALIDALDPDVAALVVEHHGAYNATDWRQILCTQSAEDALTVCAATDGVMAGIPEITEVQFFYRDIYLDRAGTFIHTWRLASKSGTGCAWLGPEDDEPYAS